MRTQAKQRMATALHKNTRTTGEQLDLQVGSMIDYYRESGSKDFPGWKGPSRVTDISNMTHGNITHEYLGRSMISRIADVRNALVHIVFEIAFLGMNTVWRVGQSSPTTIVMTFAMNLPQNTCIHLGWQNTASGWQLTRDTTQYYQIYLATLHLAACGIHLMRVISARIAHGVSFLPAVADCDETVVCWWHIKHADNISSAYIPGCQKVNIRQMCMHASTPFDEWMNICMIQFVLVDSNIVEEVAKQAPDIPNLGGPDLPGFQPRWTNAPSQEAMTPYNKRSRDEDIESHGDTSRLKYGPLTPQVRHRCEPDSGNPTPRQKIKSDEHHESTEHTSQEHEETLEHAQSEEDDFMMLDARDLGSERITDNEHDELTREWQYVMNTSQEFDHVHELSVIPQYHLLSATVEANTVSDPTCVTWGSQGITTYWQDEKHEPAEIMAHASDAYLLHDFHEHINAQSWIILMFHTTGEREVVIDRDVRTMTPTEVKDNSEEVKSAMLAELQKWVNLKAFHRQKRAHAENPVDSRWVLTWKYIDGVRSVKARLCLRGFKDLAVDNLHTYSSTAGRWGQRVVCTTASQHRWNIVSADVGNAFLRGLTFNELAEVQGTSPRVVCMEIPKGTVPLLQTFSEYADFNVVHEILRLDRPAYGLNDAPRAWGLRLLQFMTAHSLYPTHVDPQIYVRHENGKLVVIASAHVDDIKIAASDTHIKQIIADLEAAFGKVKVEWNNFTHCGIRHIQDTHDFSISLDQIEYVSALRSVNIVELKGKSDDELLDTRFHNAYMSLLGGVAWVVQTRSDICVYVQNLQRKAKSPNVGDLRRLNKLATYMQKKPNKLVYKHLDGELMLSVAVDSAYKREEDEGHALYGAVFGIVASDGTTPGGKMQVLEWTCKKQKHVTRSTWASELFATCDAVDMTMIILCLLHEVKHGVVASADALMQFRTENISDLKVCVSTDS